MTTGIIYKATNFKTDKVYIGQTTKSLKQRIRGHYKAAKRQVKYKFPNALRKYNKEDWNWEIIEKDVPIEELDDKEAYYIGYFNSYYNGYNSTLYSNSTRGLSRNNTIYELFKPGYGIIKGTRCDLIKINNKLERLNSLISGKVNHINGFVLAVNKDKYDEIIGLHEFYHPDHGIVKDTCININIKYFGIRKSGISKLLSGNRRIYRKWILAKYKDEYNEIARIITLQHDEYGIHTLSTIDFNKKFNLSTASISHLKRKTCTQIYGWRLPENTDKYKELQNILILEHPIYGKYELSAREFTKQFGLKTHQITRLKLGLSKSTKCGWKLVTNP